MQPHGTADAAHSDDRASPGLLQGGESCHTPESCTVVDQFTHTVAGLVGVLGVLLTMLIITLVWRVRFVRQRRRQLPA